MTAGRTEYGPKGSRSGSEVSFDQFIDVSSSVNASSCINKSIPLISRSINVRNAFDRKAEPLKDKVQRCKDLLNDNDAWVCQQQLQKIYQQVLILDLEYALDKKVEQELWSLGFKNYIVTLQSQAKDRKNPKRGESQALLSWCLEAASGFYLTLLQEICTVFDLDLPFRRYISFVQVLLIHFNSLFKTFILLC